MTRIESGNQASSTDITNAPRTIVIVGFAETTRGYASKEPDDHEIWSLNRCYQFLKRWDRWFELHEPDLYTGKTGLREPDYVERLQKSTVPIYMQHPDPSIPNATQFPMDEILAAGFRNYFTTSIAHMLALAAYEHKVLGKPVQEVRIYGVDMSAFQEYSYQRPCVEYWCGVLDGLGIAAHDRRMVVVPSGSPMLRGIVTYGSHSERALWAMAEERMKIHKDNVARLSADVQSATGRIQEYGEMPSKSDPEYDDKIKARVQYLQEIHSQLLADLNATIGAQRECQHWLASVGAPQSQEQEPDVVRMPSQ